MIVLLVHTLIMNVLLLYLFTKILENLSFLAPWYLLKPQYYAYCNPCHLLFLLAHYGKRLSLIAMTCVHARSQGPDLVCTIAALPMD